MDEHLSEALRLVTEIKNAMYSVFGITRLDGLIEAAIEEIKDAAQHEKMLADALATEKSWNMTIENQLRTRIEKRKAEREPKQADGAETITERFLRILRSKNPMVYFLVKDMKIREAGEEEAVAKPCVVFRTNDSSDLGAEKFKMLQNKHNEDVLTETAVEAKCFYMIEDGNHDAD